MNYNSEQRYKHICNTANSIVKTTGKIPSELSGYEVSQAAFNKRPNGEFYLHYERWQKEASQSPISPLADLPTKAVVDAEKCVDDFKSQLNGHILNLYREASEAYEKASALRASGLERALADKERQHDEVLKTLIETEETLAGAEARIDLLTAETEELSNNVQRLLGRLEERDITRSSVTMAAGLAPEASDPTEEVSHDNAATNKGNVATADVTVGLVVEPNANQAGQPLPRQAASDTESLSSNTDDDGQVHGTIGDPS